jgi:hypothetical protein
MLNAYISNFINNNELKILISYINWIIYKF